jgi:hypothetical protein
MELIRRLEKEGIDEDCLSPQLMTEAVVGRIIKLIDEMYLHGQLRRLLEKNGGSKLKIRVEHEYNPAHENSAMRVYVNPNDARDLELYISLHEIQVALNQSRIGPLYNQRLVSNGTICHSDMEFFLVVLQHELVHLLCGALGWSAENHGDGFLHYQNRIFGLSGYERKAYIKEDVVVVDQ